MSVGDPVLAAGGVVWRRNGSGELEVVLIHRPRYDDWSLPKGKLDPGESDEDAARREVLEETSLAVDLGPELPTTTYLDRSGKRKRVRYWAMTVTPGSADVSAANEVDRAEWVPLADAAGRVSYPHDRDVLTALSDALR
ncbi:MAG TPA: NUDIX hydrolase [Acidimicrobiales bacterium]|nr:NUDIX hydrolase [Acidimicrobiales bacterium]